MEWTLHVEMYSGQLSEKARDTLVDAFIEFVQTPFWAEPVHEGSDHCDILSFKHLAWTQKGDTLYFEFIVKVMKFEVPKSVMVKLPEWVKGYGIIKSCRYVLTSRMEGLIF